MKKVAEMTPEERRLLEDSALAAQKACAQVLLGLDVRSQLAALTLLLGAVVQEHNVNPMAVMEPIMMAAVVGPPLEAIAEMKTSEEDAN